MNDVKGEDMSQKSILWATMLVVLLAAVGLSVALAGTSKRSGSHTAASWVSGPPPAPDDASWVGNPGDDAAGSA
jgi:hypothetical protein